MSTKFVAVSAVTILVGGCAADRPMPTEWEASAPVFVTQNSNLGTHMTGAEEVFTPAVPGGPTPADSRAQGQSIFHVAADGGTVDFRLNAANIDNVIMAHIHCGRPGANGPISMWLFPVIGPTGAPLPEEGVRRTACWPQVPSRRSASSVLPSRSASIRRSSTRCAPASSM